MRTPAIAADQFGVLHFTVQIVVVTEVVGAELDLRRARAGLNTRQIGNVDRDLADSQSADRQLGGFSFLVADPQFGREGVRPLRVQLSVPGREALILDILAGFQRQPRLRGRAAVNEGRRGRTVERGAGRLLEGHGQPVVGVDVPVDFRKVLLVLDGRRHIDERTGFIAVARLGALPEGFDGRSGDARNRICEAGVDRTFVQRELRLKLFVRREEEQGVADDRTAQGGAPGLFVEDAVIVLAGAETVAARAVTPVPVAQQAVVRLLIEGRAREGVGAGLGDGVDRTADEAVVDDAEGRHRNVQSLNGVDGDRRPLGGIAVAVQAELVVLANAVDGELVLARIGAGERQGVFVRGVKRHKRIEARDVLRITADRGGGGDVARAVVRAGAVAEVVGEALAGHRNGFQLGGGLIDDHVAVDGVAHTDAVQLNAAFTGRA